MKVRFATCTQAQFAAKVTGSTLIAGATYFIVNGTMLMVAKAESTNTYKIVLQDAVASKPVVDSTGLRLSYIDGSGVTRYIDLSSLTLGDKTSNYMLITSGTVNAMNGVYYLGKVGPKYPRTAIPTVMVSPTEGGEIPSNATIQGGIVEMTTAGTISGGPDNGVTYVAGDYLICINPDPIYHKKVASGDLTKIWLGPVWKTDTAAKGIARLQNTLRIVRDDLYANYQLKGDNITMGAGKNLILDHDPVQEMEAATKRFVENLVSGLIKYKKDVEPSNTAYPNAFTGTNITGVKVGYAYRAITAGVYAGENCDAGDLIVAIDTDDYNTSGNFADIYWTVLQNNLELSTLVVGASAGGGLVEEAGANGKKLKLSDIVQSDTSSSASPAFGATFSVIDSVTRDGKGRVNGLNVKTVTMPTQTNISLTANATPAYKVLVNMTASGHGLTPTYTALIDLLLTSWVATADTGNIAATDTLKIALSRLQNRITGVESRVTTVELYQDWIEG